MDDNVGLLEECGKSSRGVRAKRHEPSMSFTVSQSERPDGPSCVEGEIVSLQATPRAPVHLRGQTVEVADPSGCPSQRTLLRILVDAKRSLEEGEDGRDHSRSVDEGPEERWCLHTERTEHLAIDHRLVADSAPVAVVTTA